MYSSELKHSQGNNLLLSDIDLNQMLLHEDLRDPLIRQVKDLEPQSSERLKKNNIKYLKGNLETLKNIIDVNGGTMFLPRIATKYLSQKQMKRIFSLSEGTLSLNVSLVSTRGFEKKRIIQQLVNDLSDLF